MMVLGLGLLFVTFWSLVFCGYPLGQHRSFFRASSNGSVPVLHRHKAKARRYESRSTENFGKASRCPG